jgi:hypothetical protein
MTSDINYDYVCKYNLVGSDTYKEHKAYQNDLLCIFNEQDYGEQIIHKMDGIYERVKDNEFMNNLFLKSAASLYLTDPSFGFRILFSIETLYLFYPCLIELLTTNKISQKTQEMLM